MMMLTVTSKGQVTLRKDLLQHLGIGPGDKLSVQKLANGRVELEGKRGTGKISDAFGMLWRENGPRLTIEEISEAAAEGWAGKR